jgi:TRAP-type mannitol/chloroaromatic compound transport system substrate-binding protein
MATTLYQLSETLSANGAALKRMQSQGVKALQFSDEIWDAFGAASTEVLNEYMDDDLYRSTRASFDASLADSAAWINKSDGYYVQQRVRVLG